MGSFIVKPRTRIVAANAVLTGVAAAVITSARLLAKARAHATAVTPVAPATRSGSAPAWIESAPALREAFQTAEQAHLRGARQSAGTSVATVKAAAFAALAATPFVLDGEDALAAEIRALDGAATLAEAAAAKEQMLAAATSIHARLQSTAVLRATQRAFLRAGLANVQHMPSLGTTHRLEATAEDGHVVIAEVGLDGSMATEILGACGSTQEALHDAIEAALEAEGIRADHRARKPTAGVATTATARDFLRRKSARSQAATDRVRHLNQQRPQTRRR